MVRAKIRYAIVALRISGTEIAELIHAATGVYVDPNADDILHELDDVQIESLWDRLSADPRWQRHNADEPFRNLAETAEAAQTPPRQVRLKEAG